VKPFIPFANEADVRQVGGLQIENRLDRVTLSGDVDLTADQAGLADARTLLQLLEAVVRSLERGPLPERLPPPARRQVDNPFA
jgi:hypothetical protein